MLFRPVSSIYGIIASAILLSGCTNTAVNVDYFAKNILSSYTFKVNNAVNQNEIEPHGNSIPFDVTCTGAISKVEVKDPTTQGWKDISEVDPSAQINCATSGAASFSLPLSHINPVANPTAQGTKRYEFPLRLTVPNITGELSNYEDTYVAVFTAPELSLNVGNVNAASPTSQVVSGTCSINGHQIHVQHAFSSSGGATTCVNGAYSVTVTLDNPDGVGDVRVSSMEGAIYYVWNSVQSTITVDRVVPAVGISTPAAGSTIISTGLNGNGGVTVTGPCESGLPVVLTATNGIPTTASCTSGAFSASIGLVSQGTMTVTATQTDSVGNSASSSRSFLIATTLPGTFAIDGVTSYLTTADIVIDNYLKGTGTKVHFGAASGTGISYDIEIRTSSDSFVTGKTNVSLTGSSLSETFSYLLTQGAQYKIYVTAKDALGNARPASNNGFTFTVDYPAPKMTSITISNPGPLGNATIGQTIKIRATFDQELTVSEEGSPNKPTISLAMTGDSGSETQTLTYARKPNAFSIEFDYVIESGKYANPMVLAVSSSLTGGKIIDAATEVAADRNFPAAGLTPSVILDTKAPAFPSMNLAPTASPYLSRTPILNFTLAADPGTVQMYAKVLKKSDNTVVKSDAVVTSGNPITDLTGVELNTEYRIYYYAKDSYGNATSTQYVEFTSFVCPTGYLYMDPTDEYAYPFCVGFTEARTGGVHSLTGTPESPVSRDSAQASCAAIPKGSLPGTFSLISNSQWNAVATAIAKRAENWTNSIVGGGSGGSIPTGFTEPSTMLLVGINQSNPCAGGTWTADCSVSPTRRRSLTLPRNQVIWDFSGNGHEFVKELDTYRYNAANTLLEFFRYRAPNVVSDGFTPNAPACTHYTDTSGTSCGYGNFLFQCSEKAGSASMSVEANCTSLTDAATITTTAVLRGGGIKSTLIPAFGGIYSAMRRLATTDNSHYNTAYRCVYQPAL